MASEQLYPVWQAHSGSDFPFTIVSMFTASYRPKAECLAASLRAFGLNYSIHEVPTVHRSISPKGTEDILYCKARFISGVLRSPPAGAALPAVGLIKRARQLALAGRRHLASWGAYQ
jgi:hypothetical protein